MNKTQYQLAKITIDELIGAEFDLNYTPEEEIERGVIIEQQDSLLFDQLRRVRGGESVRINELVYVEARKNPKKQDALVYILRDGFNYNGTHYVRFGKSASQGKAGITVFIDAAIFDEMTKVTQLDLEMDKCVISKYESQRCLLFSSCTIVDGDLPNIVIIDEYEKVIPHQYIKYVDSEEREFTDKDGKEHKYKARVIKDGYHDIELSPFDGCGCHTHEFSERVQGAVGLDYTPIGAQIRMPFIKGYSVEFPFKEYLESIDVTEITDVYGEVHQVADIDCIWNTSMFKGHKYFKKAYGAEAWHKYMEVLHKYEFKLGVSKYSHHVKNLNLKTRMNFQYLQCLDIWNPKYAAYFDSGFQGKYDILDEENAGPVIDLAKYSTELCERIIKGDKFYTYKFMGINNSEEAMTDERGKYLEAVLINDMMLKDPAIQKFIYRKLRKTIDEMKLGKVYADGYYHTVVGDMIGYLQYAAGQEPVGCLSAKEFFCDTIPKGKVLSFRSPLVCPSEVNDVYISENEYTQKWIKHFKDQDVVMLNMYDLSLPQQGGMDEDGDIVMLCDDPALVNKKVDKTMIIDIQDKVTASEKEYTKENIISYEINSRDSRIGEITNCASSILNKYAKNDKVKQQNADDVSLLRILQGEFLAPLYSNI